MNPDLMFGGDEDALQTGYGVGEVHLTHVEYVREHVDFEGPRLNYGERRKLWKDAIESGDSLISEGGLGIVPRPTAVFYRS